MKKKLNPIWWFRNDDEPIPPDWYRAKVWTWVALKRWIPNWNWLAMFLIFAGWFFYRNPLHNFMHYWLGFRSRQHLTNYTGNIWNEKSEWNIVLPFISYRKGNVERYIGWRDRIVRRLERRGEGIRRRGAYRAYAA